MTFATLNGHAIFTRHTLPAPAEKSLMICRELEMPMERGLLAPLSPNEQTALRRVAGGISRPKHLRPSSVARLKRLALVEEHEGRIRLTPLGHERCLADAGRAAATAES